MMKSKPTRELHTKTKAIVLMVGVQLAFLPSSATAQDTVTLTGQELKQVVDTACREARAMADEADGLRVQRDTIRAQRDQCVGALKQWQELDVQRVALAQQVARTESRVERWVVVVGVVAGLVLGAVGGFVVGQL